MLHELLLALSGDTGGIFVQKHKEGLKVGIEEISFQQRIGLTWLIM